MITQAKYIKGLTNLKDQPEIRPSILLLGRSNVGKSSFINALTNSKGLAKISQTPGKTLVLNYFLINDFFYLIDAPGYGYAKRSKETRYTFLEMIDDQLQYSKNLKFSVLLIDFKVGPTELDIQMYNYLQKLGIMVVVVATKKDKIPSTKRYKHERLVKDKMGNPVYFFSISNTYKLDIDKVRTFILERIII